MMISFGWMHMVSIAFQSIVDFVLFKGHVNHLYLDLQTDKTEVANVLTGLE